MPDELNDLLVELLKACIAKTNEGKYYVFFDYQPHVSRVGRVYYTTQPYQEGSEFMYLNEYAGKTPIDSLRYLIKEIIAL